MRWGVGAGASRLVSGTMTHPPPARASASPSSSAPAARCCSAPGYLANIGVVSALAGRGEVVFSDELNHASIIDGCRLSRAETFVYRHNDVEHLAWALERAAGPRRADRHRLASSRWTATSRRCAELVELARRHDVRLVVDEAHGVGCLGPGGRGAVARGRARATRSTSSSARSARRSAPTARTSRCDGELARYLVNTRAPVHLLDRAAAARGRRRARRARAARGGAAPRRAPARQRRRAARRARARGLRRRRARRRRSCRS